MIAISNIKIIGVGGAGIAILNAIKQLLPEATLAIVDTDATALAKSTIENQICLIESGEGSGGDTNIAKSACAKHATELETLLKDSRLIVLVAGLGGGTGSVVAPILSKIASENPECEVISFTVSALAIEGDEKTNLAVRAQNYLSKRCLASFSLPNDIILARQNLPIVEAYSQANASIANTVYALAKMLSSNGIVNIDFPTFVKLFSDNKEVQKCAYASFGRGFAESAVDDAIEELQKSPLLPQNFSAKTMLLALRCSPTFEMNKMQRLLELASQKFGSPARMAFGAITDDSLDSTIEVCAIGLCNHQETERVPTEEVSVEPETFSNTNDISDNSEPVQVEQQQNVEIQVAPPPERIDVSTPPVPVEPERKSFFGFGRRRKVKKGESEAEKLQTEFTFMELSEQRGFFQDTPPNIRNGVDLDVPTYMRKGIKINL